MWRDARRSRAGRAAPTFCAVRVDWHIACFEQNTSGAIVFCDRGSQDRSTLADMLRLRAVRATNRNRSEKET
jgi:hypothetical protein